MRQALRQKIQMDHPISILDQNGLKCQHSNTHPYDWNGVVFLFYHRIRELREDSDQTQAQIAQSLGLSQRAYSYYETGARDPAVGAVGSGHSVWHERGLYPRAHRRAMPLPHPG